MKVAPKVDMPDKDGIPRPSLLEEPLFPLLSLQDGSGLQHHGQERTEDSAAVLSVADSHPVSKLSLEELANCMPSEKDIPKEILALKPTENPVLLVPQQGTGNLGGTVNLILSIGKKGEKKAGILASANQAGVPASVEEEGLHKVSYCHILGRALVELLGISHTRNVCPWSNNKIF